MRDNKVFKYPKYLNGHLPDENNISYEVSKTAELLKHTSAKQPYAYSDIQNDNPRT